MVNASPADSTLNFKSKKVVLTFDEYVELDNIFDKLIVSPTLKRTPTVTAKLHTVTMVIKDTLAANTTYTFNFSDAIKDINERNPIQEFSYVVSTGDYLDSLQVRGYILDAQSGKPDSNVSVMMYRHVEDSVVAKEKPVYYARSKGNGGFWFKNLAPGDYKIFALKEEDKDLQYNQPAEQIAFGDSLVRIRETNIKDLTLLLFIEKDSTIKVPGEETTTEPEAVEEPSEKEKEKEKKKKRRLNVAVALSDNRQELGEPMLISFSEKITKLDSTAFQLTQDTTNIPVTFTTSFDSTRTKLSVHYDWKEGMAYTFIIPKESVADSTGLQMTKADTIIFKAKKESDYSKAMVSIQLSDSTKATLPDTMHFVGQLIMNKEVKYSGTFVNGSWTQKRIQPGEYEVWILLDNNNNGKWDRGVYYGTPKRQPERVVSFPKKENLKANWGVRIPLTL
jgi:5-hydroxyisourate hydrolase-like protein (transthyretin family)